MSSEQETAPEHPKTRLVLVTGSGRSGTSTAAGTLKKLGLHLPQPEVRPDASNPRGFFESRWALRFHKRVLAEAGVRTLDARPEAWAMMTPVAARPVLREELRTQLNDWLVNQLQGSQIIVKDPRAFWLRDLWVEAASDLGVHTEFLTMLRHPAEVVGSRRLHYLTGSDEKRQHLRETANMAGWVNVALTNERATRGSQRAFAQYTDLISDWRSTMQAVGDQLDLTYNADLATSEHHEVDDFIDANLRRAQGSWDGLDLPDQLREIAETVWQNLSALTVDPQDPSATASLDAMHEKYLALHTHSLALVADSMSSAIRTAREKTRTRVTRKLRRKFDKDLQLARSVPPPPPPPPAPASIPRRVMRKVRAQAKKL